MPSSAFCGCSLLHITINLKHVQHIHVNETVLNVFLITFWAETLLVINLLLLAGPVQEANLHLCSWGSEVGSLPSSAMYVMDISFSFQPCGFAVFCSGGKCFVSVHSSHTVYRYINLWSFVICICFCLFWCGPRIWAQGLKNIRQAVYSVIQWIVGYR